MYAKTISISKMERRCGQVSALLRALSHPGRLLIMGHLCQGEKTVSELVESCGLSQSQLSQFLGRMKLEGLVVCERRGRFQYYSPADSKIVKLIRAVQDLYC